MTNIINWAEQVPILVSSVDGSEEDLRNSAEGTQVWQRWDYLDRCQGRGETVGNNAYRDGVADGNRALANHLRHCYTNYDELLNALGKWECNYQHTCGDDDDLDADGTCTWCWEQAQETLRDEQTLAYEIIRERTLSELARAFPQFAEIIL